jgi:hypothetical protein
MLGVGGSCGRRFDAGGRESAAAANWLSDFLELKYSSLFYGIRGVGRVVAACALLVLVLHIHAHVTRLCK